MTAEILVFCGTEKETVFVHAFELFIKLQNSHSTEILNETVSDQIYYMVITDA